MRAVLAIALLLPLAGCVSQPAALLDQASLGIPLTLTDEAGAPVPYAAITFLAGDLVVARGSTDALGALPPAPAAWTRAVVSASGFESRNFTPFELGVAPVLRHAVASTEPVDASPVLRMLAPYEFGAVSLGPGQLCDHRNTCGLSEPTVEVAGDGSIYVSSVCCVGKAPPVWASRDGGATWVELETPGVREAVGIEGDFAIDDAGNLYFTDILLGALWLTSWDAEGNWRHTVPVPLAPLVDRPWVRAGAEDVVYFLYNTGTSTNFHVSTDGGRTFHPVPTARFPAPLGALGQGPERDHLWATAGLTLYESTDGGATWSAGEEIPRPDDAEGLGRDSYAVPVVDESGRVLVTYELGNETRGYAIFAAFRGLDASWRLEQVTPWGGTHVMPWPASGPDGGFVVAWYGSDDDAASPNTIEAAARWFVHLAATHDAGASWQTVRADPEPVLSGPMNRRLLDFLQVDLAPDGAAHLVYATNRDDSNAERTWYARTTTGLGLAPLAFANGPRVQANESVALLPFARQPTMS